MIRDLIESWMRVLTEPNLETFEAEKAKADAGKAALGVAFAGLMGGLVMVQLTDPAMTIITVLARSTFFAVIDFLVASLVLFFIAKLFGGEGDFTEHSYLLSLPAVPLVTIAAVLGRGTWAKVILAPLSPIAVVQGILILLLIYGIFLLLMALQAAHNLKASQTLNVLGISVLGWGILAVAAMFASGAENALTKSVYFMLFHRDRLLEQTLSHAWLVIFSMIIAIILGVIIGILITLPSRRPRPSHLLVLLPLALLVVLYLLAGDTFGQPMADWFDDYFPKAQGIAVIGITLVVILYPLFIFGETAAELVLYLAGIMLTIPSIALFGLFIPLFGIGFINAAVALVVYAQLPILRNTYTGINEVSPAVVESARAMGMTEWQLLYKIKLPMAVPVIMAGVRISMVMIVGIAAIAKLIGVTCLGKYIFDGIGRASDMMVIAGAVGVSIFALLVDGLLGWAEGTLTPAGLREERRGG